MERATCIIYEGFYKSDFIHPFFTPFLFPVSLSLSLFSVGFRRGVCMCACVCARVCVCVCVCARACACANVCLGCAQIAAIKTHGAIRWSYQSKCLAPLIAFEIYACNKDLLGENIEIDRGGIVWEDSLFMQIGCCIYTK